MKIIQFVPTLESGGVEQGVLEIAKALVLGGHESHVVSSGGRLVGNLTINGTHHHQWDLHKKSLLTFRHVKPLREWIISMKCDVLHVRSRMPAWIVWKALQGISKENRPALVSTVHGLHSINFYSAIMTKPYNIIAVSKSSEHYIIKNYTKKKAKNIKLIFRGIDESSYHFGYKPSEEWLSQWYKDYPGTRSSKLLTIAGRISPLKDFEKIIYLAKRIKEDTSHPIKILIAGEAKGKHIKYLKKLKMLILKLGLIDDIYFLNFRKDIKNIYSISSIAFNTSNKPESFGRSVLEPLSLGIPTLGYNRGGVDEILEELYPFGAIQPNNENELLNKSLSILDGNNIAIKANNKFLTSDMCLKTLNLYRDISSC